MIVHRVGRSSWITDHDKRGYPRLRSFTCLRIDKRRSTYYGTDYIWSQVVKSTKLTRVLRRLQKLRLTG